MTPPIDRWQIAGIVAWCLCLICLSPAVLRLFGRGTKRHDPIWGLVAMLTVNRLLFLLHAPRWINHSTAIALALITAAFAVRYQLNDDLMVDRPTDQPMVDGGD